MPDRFPCFVILSEVRREPNAAKDLCCTLLERSRTLYQLGPPGMFATRTPELSSTLASPIGVPHFALRQRQQEMPLEHALQ
jgi:hypothetical protein